METVEGFPRETLQSSTVRVFQAVSAEEGLIATAYERRGDVYSRLHQMVKLFMFSPVSGLYSCPLAMTDGAAKTIEVNSDFMEPEQLQIKPCFSP